MKKSFIKAPQAALRSSWKNDQIIAAATMKRQIHSGPVIRHTNRLKKTSMEIDVATGEVTRFVG